MPKWPSRKLVITWKRKDTFYSHCWTGPGAYWHFHHHHLPLFWSKISNSKGRRPIHLNLLGNACPGRIADENMLRHDVSICIFSLPVTYRKVVKNWRANKFRRFLLLKNEKALKNCSLTLTIGSMKMDGRRMRLPWRKNSKHSKKQWRSVLNNDFPLKEVEFWKIKKIFDLTEGLREFLLLQNWNFIS